nr:hypothetical protein Iba_chr05bCG8060 [Ipomoea batatas]
MVDQPRKQLREQKGKMCPELRGKPEEYLPKSLQPGTPSEIPHSRSHNLGSKEILISPQEVMGVSLPSPHLKGWGEGPQKYPPPRGHHEPDSSGGAFPGEPVRISEESAVKEDQRHLSSSSWENERILLPSIEPKIIPEDVCVAEELDPEEHPEERRLRLRLHNESQTEATGESVETIEGVWEGGDGRSASKATKGTKGKAVSGVAGEAGGGVMGVSLPSPHLKGWGEGPQKYPPPRGHHGPASSGGAFPGEPVRLSEESAVKEDQRHLSSSSWEI